MLTHKNTIGELIEAIKLEGKVVVRDLGTFTVRDTPERQGRNPATGEPLMIPAGKRLTFKPSPALKGNL